MTIRDFILETQQKLEEVLRENKPLEIAARSSHQVMSQRIFGDGKQKNGTLIGQYDTQRELYIKPEGYWDFAALKPPKGKYGNREFKNGKPHKTRYQANYASLRQNIGRKTDKVDFFIRGAFRSDFMNAEIIAKAKPLKIDKNLYQVEFRGKKGEGKNSITHGELAEAFDIKYGKKKGAIFSISENERRIFYQVAEDTLRQLYDT